MGKRILLVDDEADFRELMDTRISGWGYDFIAAANGKEAVDILTHNPPDIIILDYVMPEMDGVATLEEIRKIDKEVPVIMFTAHPDIKAMKGTKKLGVSAFIPKLSVYAEAQSALKTALDLVEKKLDKKEQKSG